MSGSVAPRALLATCVVVGWTGAAVAQEPPRFSERVDVARLLLDVRVVDKAWRPVPGLQVEDFKVTVGGKAARVDSVQWVAGALENEVASSGATDVPREPPVAQGRLIVFLFQKSLDPSRIVGLMRMLIEAQTFLDTFTPQDRVAVLSFDSHLKIWLDFTNDLDRVRNVLARAILFEGAAPVQQAPLPSLLARLESARARRVYSIEKALSSLGEALQSLPGAKSVIIVGHGFGQLGRGLEVTLSPAYDEARDALEAARASVFSLDVTNADYHSLELGLQVVAEDTGGFFARTHIFPERALERVAGALAGHYVLFVEIPELGRGVHRIDVRLERPGVVLAKRFHVVR